MKYHKLIKFLNNEDIDYVKNKDLSRLNSMKLKAVSKLFIIVKSTDKLRRLLIYLNSLKMKFYLLGKGSNTLFVEKKVKIPLIRLELDELVYINNSFLIVNANISNMKLSSILLRKGYSNFEFASVIPGCVGAGIALNSSYNNISFSDNLMYVETIDQKGNIHWLDKQAIKFGYRTSSILEKNLIITKAIFKLEKKDKDLIKNQILSYIQHKSKVQPVCYPSLGSVFRNGELKAYEYIKNVGMSGFKKGGAMISTLHNNFIINFNNASGKDVLFIIEKAQKKVYDKYKVNLILEITLIRGRK